MRVKFIFTILLLVLASFTLAAPAENITNEFGAIKGTLDQATVDVLEKQITYPAAISPVLSFLFGVSPTLERLIVLIGIFITLFILIKGILVFIPMFDEEKIQIGIALIVSTLILITGTIETLSTNYFDYLATLKLLENSGVLRMIVGVFFLVLVVFVLDRIFKKISMKLAFEKAEVVGERINLVSAIGKEMSKNMSK